ncbi:MAG: hemerythrin domain-containing protein [Chitinophagaceae bacterium]
MKRYNIFNQVHKGLRELLYQTASRLQQTDFTTVHEKTAALTQVNMVIDLFDKHAHTEDYFILPALAQYEPSVCNLFEEEHVQDHALGEKLREIIRGIDQSVSDEDVNTWGAVLRPVFVEFLVFNLNHMAKEEEVLNKLLWRYYSDEELKGITQQIIAHQPPEAMQLFSSWMMKGLSNSEISDWLLEVRNSAPEIMFNNLCHLAESELPSSRWNQIRDSILEKQSLAS